MKKVLVTGGKGQLGSCIKDIKQNFSNLELVYMDLPDLDITNKEQLSKLFEEAKFSWCINCAAYTQVDKAETDKDLAYLVNERGAYYLASLCKEHNVKLIHISTDFVFNGKSAVPYGENDPTNPISVYGDSKLKGEDKVASIFEDYYIIRTSWLYSEFGHNFFKTMLNLAQTKNELNVIFDQIGTPTYAGDLAEFIFKIITLDNNNFGIYHFSNEGVASWYDFAKAIFDDSSIDIKVNAIKTKDYLTLAARPHFSVLDKTKSKATFQIEIPYWRDSLKKALNKHYAQ